MENKDIAYQFIDNDAVRMNNGDNMVDVSTAYLAVDRARTDERERILAGWKPTTVPVTTTGLVDVLFSDGTIRGIVGDHVCNWAYPYLKSDTLWLGGCETAIRMITDLKNRRLFPSLFNR